MSPFFEIGQLVTFLYFIFFVVFLPVFGLSEKLAYHLYIESADMKQNKISARLYLLHIRQHATILLKTLI